MIDTPPTAHDELGSVNTATSIPLAPHVIDKLVELWRPYDAGDPAVHRMIDDAVDALRRTHVAGPPHTLDPRSFVLLVNWSDPGVRAVFTPLLDPDALRAADIHCLVLERLGTLIQTGFDPVTAADLVQAEAEAVLHLTLGDTEGV